MARNLWRMFFALGGLGILAGGPLHPAGTMAEMLAHADWFRSHALMLAGFVAMAIGLLLFGRTSGLPARTNWWLRAAVVGCVLQSIEMAFHTAAMVDHDKLVSGASTPVLTTHLWMTALLYPVFAVTFTGFVVVAAKDRALGSWWIAWLGIAGALAHGAAGPLVVIWEIDWARELFPLVVLVAIWFVIAACWPVRASRAGPAWMEPR